MGDYNLKHLFQQD